MILYFDYSLKRSRYRFHRTHCECPNFNRTYVGNVWINVRPPWVDGSVYNASFTSEMPTSEERTHIGDSFVATHSSNLGLRECTSIGEQVKALPPSQTEGIPRGRSWSSHAISCCRWFALRFIMFKSFGERGTCRIMDSNRWLYLNRKVRYQPEKV